MKALLHLDPVKYPSLFNSPGNQKKHPLYHQDESRANCLHLAIEDGQIEICHKIIGLLDVFSLKTMPIVDNKTASKYVKEKISEGFDEFIELRDFIEENLQKQKVAAVNKKNKDKKSSSPLEPKSRRKGAGSQSIDEVLSYLSLDDLKPAFRREGVEYDDLSKMSNDDLRDLVGVHKFRDRKRILFKDN